MQLKVVADLVASYGMSTSAGCLAGAGRKLEDRLEVTNYDVGQQDIVFGELPAALFPVHATVIMNGMFVVSGAGCDMMEDLESTCYGLRALHERKRLSEFFEHMWGPCGNSGELHSGHSTLCFVHS